MPKLHYEAPPGPFPASRGAFGGLLIQDGMVTQVINIAPAKMTGWALTSTSFLNMTLDVSDDSITILIAGIYIGAASVAYSGSANIQTELHFRVDGVEQPVGAHRKLSGGDIGSASFQIPPVSLALGQVCTVYIEAGSNGVNFFPIDAQFALWRIA